MSSRIESAAENTKASTAGTPKGTPTTTGRASIDRIDVGEMNSAGGKVQGYQQDGNNTSKKRDSENPNRKQPQYQKYEALPGDQPPSPETPDAISATPAPQTKSYTESLMDQQMAKYMNQPTGEGSTNKNYGHTTPDPNNRVQDSPRDQKSQDRGPDRSHNSDQYKVKESAPLPRSSYDEPKGAPTYMSPPVDMGPKWMEPTAPKPPGVVTPRVESAGTTMPNPKFKTPQFKTPKFK